MNVRQLVRLRQRKSAGTIVVVRWSRGYRLLPLMFPIAAADFDYRYLLLVLPLACLAAGLAFAPVNVGNRVPAGGVSSSGRTHDDTA